MNLKEYLKKNSIPVTQFAKDLGLNYSHIWMVVKGDRPVSKDLAYHVEAYTNGELKAVDLMRPAKKAELCPTCGRKIPR